MHIRQRRLKRGTNRAPTGRSQVGNRSRMHALNRSILLLGLLLAAPVATSVNAAVVRPTRTPLPTRTPRNYTPPAGTITATAPRRDGHPHTAASVHTNHHASSSQQFSHADPELLRPVGLVPCRHLLHHRYCAERYRLGKFQSQSARQRQSGHLRRPHRRRPRCQHDSMVPGQGERNRSRSERRSLWVHSR